jgi:hypothetical protein
MGKKTNATTGSLKRINLKLVKKLLAATKGFDGKYVTFKFIDETEVINTLHVKQYVEGFACYTDSLTKIEADTPEQAALSWILDCYSTYNVAVIDD